MLIIYEIFSYCYENNFFLPLNPHILYFKCPHLFSGSLVLWKQEEGVECKGLSSLSTYFIERLLPQHQYLKTMENLLLSQERCIKYRQAKFLTRLFTRKYLLSLGINHQQVSLHSWAVLLALSPVFCFSRNKVAIRMKGLPILWAAAPIILCIDIKPYRCNIRKVICKVCVKLRTKGDHMETRTPIFTQI